MLGDCLPGALLMLLLGIDTCTRRVGVVLANDHGSMGQILLGGPGTSGPPRHVEQLALAIQQLSQQCQVSLGDIDALAVTIGPGMFTGLRVGVVTACTMATALSVPVIELTSLDVLAHPWRDDPSDVVVPMIDARRSEVYCAYYHHEGDRLVRVGEYLIVRPEEFAHELGRSGATVRLCGDGAVRFRDAFVSNAKVAAAVAAHASPSLDSLTELATESWRRGECTDPLTVRPLYLRRSDAEINVVRVAGRQS